MNVSPPRGKGKKANTATSLVVEKERTANRVTYVLILRAKEKGVCSILTRCDMQGFEEVARGPEQLLNDDDAPA